MLQEAQRKQTEKQGMANHLYNLFGPVSPLQFHVINAFLQITIPSECTRETPATSETLQV